MRYVYIRYLPALKLLNRPFHKANSCLIKISDHKASDVKRASFDYKYRVKI